MFNNNMLNDKLWKKFIFFFNITDYIEREGRQEITGIDISCPLYILSIQY